MSMMYTTQGTCSRKISFDVVDGKVQNVTFMGGCNGNQKGISSLVEGMPIQDVIARLKGITCGPRPTSCPDQLATALQLLPRSAIIDYPPLSYLKRISFLRKALSMSVLKTVLSNGMSVISYSMPSVRSVSLGLWFNVGSRDERPDQAGLTHFYGTYDV